MDVFRHYSIWVFPKENINKQLEFYVSLELKADWFLIALVK